LAYFVEDNVNFRARYLNQHAGANANLCPCNTVGLRNDADFYYRRIFDGPKGPEGDGRWMGAWNAAETQEPNKSVWANWTPVLTWQPDIEGVMSLYCSSLVWWKDNSEKFASKFETVNYYETLLANNFDASKVPWTRSVYQVNENMQDWQDMSPEPIMRLMHLSIVWGTHKGNENLDSSYYCNICHQGPYLQNACPLIKYKGGQPPAWYAHCIPTHASMPPTMGYSVCRLCRYFAANWEWSKSTDTFQQYWIKAMTELTNLPKVGERLTHHQYGHVGCGDHTHRNHRYLSRQTPEQEMVIANLTLTYGKPRRTARAAGKSVET
jgi:hypothetical protein